MSESNDRRIDDATPDTNVTGVEKVPVSDGGTAKCLTVEQIKDFVATKFAALTDASDVAVNSDGVYLKKDGELKPVAANVFADAIIAFMFGKEAETGLAETDEIVIRRDGDTKKTTIADLVEIVKESVQPPNIDIDSLDETSFGWGDDIVSQIAVTVPNDETGEVETKKTCLTNLCHSIVNFVINNGNPEALSFGTRDMFVIAVRDDESGKFSLHRISKELLGIKDGDVKGPSANTANKIPQWDGANSNKLKDGLNLATNITSQSGETEVPTALAVHNAVKDKANAPSSNTANRIPQWNGANSKTLKDGLDFVTSMGNTPSDAKILSEKAVSDAIAAAFTNALASGGSIATAISSAITAALTATGSIGLALAEKVGAPSYSTQDYIPQWDSTSKTLKNGKQVVTEIGTSASNDQIPTAQAVKNAITGTDTSNLVKMTSSTTQGQIPKWSSTSKTFDSSGFSVSDVVPSYGSSSELPTTNALLKAIKRAVTVSSSQPPTGSGHEKGELWYCTYSGGNPRYDGLYINLGDAASASWLRIAQAS